MDALVDRMIAMKLEKHPAAATTRLVLVPTARRHNWIATVLMHV